MRLGVVILAAGASVRMGRPKLLLPWGSQTVLAHLLDQWRAVRPAQIAIVCTATEPALQAELDRLAWPAEQRIVNPDPARGMFSSIQCAAHWPDWSVSLSHWAIALGDQPLVRTRSLQQLVGFAAEHPKQACQPSWEGRGRHPVLLPAALFARLRSTSAGTLKQFLAEGGMDPALCPVDDPGLNLDLDLPSDYEAALTLRRRVAS